jgi:hypothetical protein
MNRCVLVLAAVLAVFATCEATSRLQKSEGQVKVSLKKLPGITAEPAYRSAPTYLKFDIEVDKAYTFEAAIDANAQGASIYIDSKHDGDFVHGIRVPMQLAMHGNQTEFSADLFIPIEQIARKRTLDVPIHISVTKKADGSWTGTTTQVSLFAGMVA